MSGNAKSLIFSGIMCLVCGLLLTAASSGLKPFQERNMAIDKHKNILKAVGIVDPERAYAGPEIESLYEANIRHAWVDADGAFVPDDRRTGKELSLYLQMKGEDIAAYVIPVESRGLWGKINGYIALDTDGSTVKGFTVYQHNETPGLGGEIEKNWFQKNFEGKKIVAQDGAFVSVAIAKGKAAETMPEEKRSHYVDGISGATLTGKYLTGGLREVLTAYEPVSVRFRGNPAGTPETTPSGAAQ